MPIGYNPTNNSDAHKHSITNISYLYEPTTFGGDTVVAYLYYDAGTNSYYVQETNANPSFWSNLVANVPIGSTLYGAYAGTAVGAVVPVTLAQAQGLQQQYPPTPPGQTPDPTKKGSGNCASAS
jgi:hypothetical protein